MPFLQSSGEISLNSIKNLFGGPGSPQMSNYYRGGQYIPATKPGSREPTTGDSYSLNVTHWRGDDYGGFQLLWNGSTIVPGSSGWSTGPGGMTSYSTGGFTYFRGALRLDDSGYGQSGYRFYAVYRVSNTLININTGIPSSGTISLSQFYGAEKP